MISLQLKSLADYFHSSSQFYYILTDREGRFLYVNPLLQEHYDHIAADLNKQAAADIFAPADRDKYKMVIKQCLQQRGATILVDLQMRSGASIIRWEFSACNAEEGNIENIQAIGISPGLGKKENEETGLSERYLAYEQTTEGLWCFELKKPVSINASPDEIIANCREHAYLVECNDNMARMYGFTSSEELTGSAMEDLMDMTDAGRQEYLKNFIRNGFNSSQVETKEYDRYGRTVYFLNNIRGVVEDGFLKRIWGAQKDITEQKNLSEQLMEQEIQRQKQITQATIDGQEKERLQMGKELHDNINQHLSTARLYLEVVKDKTSGEVFTMVNLAYKQVSDIINEIRQLSQSLVPPTLGDLGLIDSVQDICDSLKRAHRFNIEFHHRYFSEEQLPDNLKLMFFRIFQEQINNIIRHAEANSIQVHLQTDAEYMTLIMIDNGKGFDTANYKKGLGFTSITNRASLFNGKVEIDSHPGQGCRLSVTVPS